MCPIIQCLTRSVMLPVRHLWRLQMVSTAAEMITLNVSEVLMSNAASVSLLRAKPTLSLLQNVPIVSVAEFNKSSGWRTPQTIPVMTGRIRRATSTRIVDHSRPAGLPRISMEKVPATRGLDFSGLSRTRGRLFPEKAVFSCPIRLRRPNRKRLVLPVGLRPLQQVRNLLTKWILPKAALNLQYLRSQKRTQNAGTF